MIKLPSIHIKLSKPEKTFLLLLVIWSLVNLIQAVFMEIISDEAYYGMYARYLNWGYFDHPPMVALLIRISSLVFSGNLGIRFMTILLQASTILLIWKILNIRKVDSSVVITFFIIAGSISLFSAFGVITAPDAPLLFFTALFLLAYKNFIDSPKWTTTLLLSVSMAGLVYSKYQAVLVIGFVILSNIRLLKLYKFWLSGIFALALFSPHIYWQFVNHFPSLQFHLIDRSDSFDWIYFLEYLPNQMAVFNPFTLGAIIYILVKYRPMGQFSKSLYFLVIGFIGFFWLICSRGHVEPNWTIACSIPMIILISEKSPDDTSLFRFTRRFILPSISLLLIIRIMLMTNYDFNKSLGFSGKEERYKFIESVAGDLPVIFTGSFQEPSLYPFFTGKEATVISSVYTRLTQFDIWQFEKKYHNKPVFVHTGKDRESKIYGSGSIQFSGFKTDSLQTVNRMEITFSLSEISFDPGDSINISFTLKNPYDYDIDFNHRQFPVEIWLVFKKGVGDCIQPVSLTEPVGIISSGDTVNRILSARIPALTGGEYKVGISLNTKLGPSLNSKFRKIEIGNDD